MNVQKMLMGVATTAVGFAFGLYVYNKFLVGSAMTKSAETMEDGSDTEGE
jgi:hypothetical protein